MKLRTLRKFLQTRGLPSLDERYAILAYGSNACPHQLSNKHLTDVLVLYGRLGGAEAVYARRKTQKGYVPATLARKSGTRSSWVTFLTGQQLAAMDTSEGRHNNTYMLAELRNVQFLVGRSRCFPLYTYINVRGGVLTCRGKPVSLRSTSQKRIKRLLADASEGVPADFLDYTIIPNPNPPSRYSQIYRR